jgi:hypothetical protein
MTLRSDKGLRSPDSVTLWTLMAVEEERWQQERGRWKTGRLMGGAGGCGLDSAPRAVGK